MNLYIVRHGESEDSASGLHQSKQSPLSPAGIRQAELLAERLSKIGADLILSSPIQRAKQTAEIAGKRLGKPVEYSELFEESRDPSKIIQKPVNDPEVMAIKKVIRENVEDANWKHSDEETFVELRNRAVRALRYLNNLEKESVILVTHGAFMAMLLSVMAFGEEIHPNIYLNLRNFMWDHNTGLTMCKYSNSKWKLLTWNDYAHLG